MYKDMICEDNNNKKNFCVLLKLSWYQFKLECYKFKYCKPKEIIYCVYIYKFCTLQKLPCQQIGKFTVNFLGGENLTYKKKWKNRL